MMTKKSVLLGPFKQVLTLSDLPLKGALKDSDLQILESAGIRIENGIIREVGDFYTLKDNLPSSIDVYELEGEYIALPGFIDCHTHIAFGGSRANDFAMRNGGSSYLEIAATGGGIWSTVQHTRVCSEQELANLTGERADKLLQQGITTIEVKSGYGLTVDEEYKILRAIRKADENTPFDLVPTCLAAHTFPKDFDGTPEEYLKHIANNLFPLLKKEGLSNRIDAFIEQSAFSPEQINTYFETAKSQGFDLTVHADQFSTSGSKVAVSFGALSADHLEASTEEEIALLAKSDTVAVALPAASLGLGCAFTPARQLLDAGACLAIATDWNPGSAPMGQLIASASILATMQKLSTAEVLAGITFRAAKALGLTDRGRIEIGFIGDLVLYQTDNYQQILYQQGTLQPQSVWKNGEEVFKK